MNNAAEVENIGMPRTTNITDYRDAKIKMLEKDFKFRLTEEDRNHANNLTTEIQIDQFCRSIISRWG